MRLMNYCARTVPALVLLLLLAPLAACSDPYGPQEWDATPETAQLWSASRSALLGKPSAFDLTTSPPYALNIEDAAAYNGYDIILIDVNGQLALAPASYFAGQNTRSGIAVRENTSLADVTKAPADTADYLHAPVPLKMGAVYIVRTRVNTCETGYSSGTRYAKLTPVEINQQGGYLRFQLVRNPFCSNRDFIPPKTGD